MYILYLYILQSAILFINIKTQYNLRNINTAKTTDHKSTQATPTSVYMDYNN